MRIPGYNGDMEEPWYWEHYGRFIYEYSYYTDKVRAQCTPDEQNDVRTTGVYDVRKSTINQEIRKMKRKQKCTKNLFLRLHWSGIHGNYYGHESGYVSVNILFKTSSSGGEREIIT